MFMQIIAIAFGLWAAVVGWGVNEVTKTIAVIAGRQEAFSNGYQQFALANERRISVIEEQQKTQDVKFEALLATVNTHLAEDQRRHAEQEVDLHNQIDAMKRELKK